MKSSIYILLFTAMFTTHLAYSTSERRQVDFFKKAVDSVLESEGFVFPSKTHFRKCGSALGTLKNKILHADYKGFYQWFYRQYARVKSSACVRKSFKTASDLYWKSKIIPLDQHDGKRVFPFGEIEEGDVVCTTSDGYDFYLPDYVVNSDFLSFDVISSFSSFVKDLKNNGIVLNSRIFYVLCLLARLEFDDTLESLFTDLIMHLSDIELINLIKIQSKLDINNPFIVEKIYASVSFVLIDRYTPSQIDTLIRKHLSLDLPLLFQLKNSLSQTYRAMISNLFLLQDA